MRVLKVHHIWRKNENNKKRAQQNIKCTKKKGIRYMKKDSLKDSLCVCVCERVRVCVHV